MVRIIWKINSFPKKEEAKKGEGEGVKEREKGGRGIRKERWREGENEREKKNGWKEGGEREERSGGRDKRKERKEGEGGRQGGRKERR